MLDFPSPQVMCPRMRLGKILSNYSIQYAPFHKANQRLSVEARAKYRCDTSVIADNDSKGRYPKMCSHTSAGSCSIATAHSGRGVRVTLRASSIFSYNWWLYTPPQGWDSYPWESTESHPRLTNGLIEMGLARKAPWYEEAIRAGSRPFLGILMSFLRYNRKKYEAKRE